MKLLQKEHYGIVGELTAQNDWLKKTGEIGILLDFPCQVIEENFYFSISEQCQWYGISRSKYYYVPKAKEDKFAS